MCTDGGNTLRFQNMKRKFRNSHAKHKIYHNCNQVNTYLIVMLASGEGDLIFFFYFEELATKPVFW